MLARVLPGVSKQKKGGERESDSECVREGEREREREKGERRVTVELQHTLCSTVCTTPRTRRVRGASMAGRVAPTAINESAFMREREM